jgi:6-pyruvoyltetrahydropterin/6-carboxytetrahydropterin synthase
MTLSYIGHFDAAHRLEPYEGNCKNIHGHRWSVKVEIGPFGQADLDKAGVAYDFHDLRHHVDAVLALLDHQFVNDVIAASASAENIALWLVDRLSAPASLAGAVRAVEVWETPDTGVRIER